MENEFLEGIYDIRMDKPFNNVIQPQLNTYKDYHGVEQKYYTGKSRINKNTKMLATFKVVDYLKSGHSVQFTVEDTVTKERYQMFLSDFFDAFCGNLEKPMILKPVKKGSNLAWKQI